MPIHFECPHCTFPYAVANDAEGTTFNCSSCGEAIVVPEPPPPPLPPLELLGNSRNVLGRQHFLLWEILGIFTDWSAEPTLSEILRFIGSLIFPAALLFVLLLVISDTATAERADSAAPWFMGAFLLVAFIAYFVAVKRADDSKTRDPGTAHRLSAYLFNPAVLIMSEFRRALPVYRLMALAGALFIAGLLTAKRAGGTNYLLPPPLRGLHLFPENAPVPASSPGEAAPYVPAASWPPPSGATTVPAAPVPAAPSRYYNPEKGPPPPPP